MNKNTFKKYLRMVIKRNPFINKSDQVSTLGKVIGAAVRKPNIVLEPFFSKTFGYTLADFKDPVGAEQELRNTLRERLTTEGTFSVNYDILKIATSRALRSMGLSLQMFKPATAYQAVNALPTNTSSGYPDFFRPKGQLVSKVLSQMVSIIDSGSFNLISENHLCYESWRTQERQSGTKFRIFLIFPMLTNAFEMLFMLPILKYYQSFSEIRDPEICYSFHADFPEMKSIWYRCQLYKSTYGLDYTQFDSTVSQKMIVWSMHTIKSLFNMQPWQAKIFDELVIIHSNSLVLSSDNGIPVFYTKKSGILSGSVFTNFIGTLINCIMVEYLLYVNGIKPKDVFKKMKGDDLIISTSNELDINIFILQLEQCFGAIIKPEACQLFRPGDAIFYLGYYFTSNLKYATSTDLLKRKMTVSGRFIPEDVIPNDLRVLSKAVSILSNVTNGYELFFRLVWPNFSLVYNMDNLPEYYYDLTEREKGVTYQKRNILYDLKYGWATK